MMLLAALALWYASHEPCKQYTEGTDMYYECVTEEPVDLTPIEKEEEEVVPCN